LPQRVGGIPHTPVRFVRVTATKLAPRLNDFIFALAELRVVTPGGANAAARSSVTSLDSIEAPPRWAKVNLVDGIYPAATDAPASPGLAKLRQQRAGLLASKAGPDLVAKLERAQNQLAEVSDAITKLPPPAFVVFAGTSDFDPAGEFRATFGKPRPIHLLARGGESSPKQEVPPGTIGARFEIAPSADESARRGALAEWILRDDNAFTWRSIVNRVWHYHFGRGIVETPNDFGRMGAEPTHPELLDWLAVDFRDNGKSLKRLHRLIVTSSTYRQSSATNAAHAKIDGNNQFLWRQNRRRLDAEAVHDTTLFVAGLLDRTAGGPGFKAFGFEDDHSPRYNYAEFDPDDPKTHRRSIYRLIARSAPDPFMETLDCADPTLIVERRNETLTALQALALLNNRFMVRMSEHFASRVARTSPELKEQLGVACILAISRKPTDDELAELVNVAQKHGLPNACRLILNMNEFVFVD
jgi:hypothetical protein